MNDTEFVLCVRDALQDIIQRRKDVTLLAARQRSKFEHWLKFELAAVLSRQAKVTNVRLEDPFPHGTSRCDISVEVNSEKWYIELKTSNTNWRAEGLENRTRPITKNIKGIAADFEKLSVACTPAKGLAAFVLFPIPSRIWRQEHQQLDYHLGKIEMRGGIEQGGLMVGSVFVELDPEFGMAVFASEVKQVTSG